jgi:MFS family permease
VANNFVVLLAGRSIQGIGGGGIMSLVLIIFSDIVPLRQRPIYVSSIQVAWALGTISGPVTGGAIVQNTTWRWIFYINFPFCLFGLIVIPLVVRLKTLHQASLMQKVLAVDWVGGALFNFSMATFLLGVTWGGVQYAWSTYQTLLPMFLGVAGGVVTIVWEWNYAKNPFIRLNIFANRSVAGVYICAIVQGVIVSSWILHLNIWRLHVLPEG